MATNYKTKLLPKSTMKETAIPPDVAPINYPATPKATNKF